MFRNLKCLPVREDRVERIHRTPLYLHKFSDPPKIIIPFQAFRERKINTKQTKWLFESMTNAVYLLDVRASTYMSR